MPLIFLILALLPSFIVFFILPILILRSKKFNRKYGAISDLNTFPKTRNTFIFAMASWEILQLAYFASIILTKQVQIEWTVWPVIFLSLVLGLIGLPFSSHSAKHIVPIGIAWLLSLVAMYKLTISLHPADGLVPLALVGIILILVFMCVRLSITIIDHKKVKFWALEYILFGLYGTWNVVIWLI